MTTRYLDLADFLIIAEKVLGIEAKVLAKGVGVDLAESALCAPSASFTGVEFYEEFRHKAAILVKDLFKNPPLPVELGELLMHVSENLYSVIITVGKLPRVVT